MKPPAPPASTHAESDTPPSASATIELRYEDLTQDGQLKITRLLQAVGMTCFGKLWVHHPLVKTMASGVMPILTRLSLRTEGAPVMLEINTLPGMTERSLLPQAAAVHGFSYRQLCLEILARALERRTR